MTPKKCKGCKYFYITWERTFPYGCKALGFKSKKYPCDEVAQTSAMECQYYKPA